MHSDIVNRYWNMLSNVELKQDDNPGTSLSHVKWMIAELRKPKNFGKQNRWLGFIQYALISAGLTTVEAERNFTRPYFTSDANDKNSLQCIVCDTLVETFTEMHPVDALHFRGHGHYGTTVFDPMYGTSLDICVCDSCLLINKTKIYGTGRKHLDEEV